MRPFGVVGECVTIQIERDRNRLRGEAGYEADGGVRLHQAIQERSQSSPVPFLSTHPSGPERIATLKSMSERLSR